MNMLIMQKAYSVNNEHCIHNKQTVITKHRCICRFSSFVCCRQCYAIFATKKDLKSHQIQCTKSNRPNAWTYDENKEEMNSNCDIAYYVCDADGCNKMFDHYKTYYKHKRIHNKLYKCSFNGICQKAFSKRIDLFIHEKIHKKIRNEVCKYCDKRFVHPSNLKKHIKYIHGEGQEEQCKPFICKKCCKQFMRKDSLIKHLQCHLNRKDRTLFYCHEHGCNASFTTKRK
eukprot:245535_1